MLHYWKHQLSYQKRTEIEVEMVKQVEAEGEYPQGDYAFEQGILTVELTELLEASGKHWVSEIERNRLIMWQGECQQV